MQGKIIKKQIGESTFSIRPFVNLFYLEGLLIVLSAEVVSPVDLIAADKITCAANRINCETGQVRLVTVLPECNRPLRYAAPCVTLIVIIIKSNKVRVEKIENERTVRIQTELKLQIEKKS